MKKIMTMLSATLLKVADLSVASACWVLWYQPEMPEILRK